MSAAAIVVSSTVLFGSLDQFTGTWTTSGRSLTRIQITRSHDQVKLHAFGACHPQDCDWGEVIAQPYAPAVDASVSTATNAITAQYNTSFSKRFLAIVPGNSPEELRVEIFTVFTDDSGRSPNYHSVILHRSQ